MKTEKQFDINISYINEIEKTEESFVKIGNDSDTLVVSFASQGVVKKGSIFERKTSLNNLRDKYVFDILYMRNFGGWYIGALPGIGDHINHTIEFLNNMFAQYKKIILTGYSSGGYASILFGSICNANLVIASAAQTNLNTILAKLDNYRGWKRWLRKAKTTFPETWEQYSDLANVINNNTDYKLYYPSDHTILNTPLSPRMDTCTKNRMLARTMLIHRDHHYDNIKHFKSVTRLKENNILEHIEKAVRGDQS